MMAWFNENAFKRTGDLVKRTAAAGDASFGPFVKRLTPVEDDEQTGWVGEADWVRLQQEPLRGHHDGGFGDLGGLRKGG
jgi:membrane fusion protein, adhesin transport system